MIRCKPIAVCGIPTDLTLVCIFLFEQTLTGQSFLLPIAVVPNKRLIWIVSTVFYGKYHRYLLRRLCFHAEWITLIPKLTTRLIWPISLASLNHEQKLDYACGTPLTVHDILRRSCMKLKVYKSFKYQLIDRLLKIIPLLFGCKFSYDISR